MSALRQVTVSPYEERLLQALRAEPNRVAMWVALGDPARHHREILGLYSRLLHLCNAHGIEYWLEYGSLLGYVRHRGVMPWEWDMDLGCTAEHYARFLALGETVERDDPDYGFRFYTDPDYDEACYCFYLKRNPDILCDIGLYHPVGDRLVCSVPAWNYPDYAVADVLPPRRVTMLGQSALIPARGEALLAQTEAILGQCTSVTADVVRNQVGWMQYDPVPFLLTHLFHPKHAELLCSPPVLDLPEAPSIVDGFARFGARGAPFIVRHARVVGAFDTADLEQRLRALGSTGFAWRDMRHPVDDVPLADAIGDWRRGTLALNFLDTPLAGVFEAAEVDAGLARYGISAESLMLVLSPHLAGTPLHQDPITDGGGWMWLASGSKLWQLVDFGDCDRLLDASTQVLRDLPMEDLLYLDDHALWGRVHQAWLGEGDFLYFPPGFAHRVRTYAPALGLGGYAHGGEPPDSDRLQRLRAWYAANRLDPVGGVWAGHGHDAWQPADPGQGCADGG